MKDMTQTEFEILSDLFDPKAIAALCSSSCDTDDDILHTIIALTIEEEL